MVRNKSLNIMKNNFIQIINRKIIKHSFIIIVTCALGINSIIALSNPIITYLHKHSLTKPCNIPIFIPYICWRYALFQIRIISLYNNKEIILADKMLETLFPKDSKPDAEKIIVMVKELIKFFPEEEQTNMWHNFERFGVPFIKET